MGQAQNIPFVKDWRRPIKPEGPVYGQSPSSRLLADLKQLERLSGTLDDKLDEPLPCQRYLLSPLQAVERFGGFACGCNGVEITETFRAAEVGERWQAVVIDYGTGVSVPVVIVRDVRFF